MKREGNDINIAKACLHEAAGSEINEMIFPNFKWAYLLSIILQPELDK